MKKTLTGVILVVVAALIAFYALNYYIYNEKQADFTPGETVSKSGTILALNFEQITFDGPYVITAESEDGEPFSVAVPSMGLPLCVAYGAGSIVDPATLEVGQIIDVSGSVSSDGMIVPCESADHYLRISNPVQ